MIKKKWLKVLFFLLALGIMCSLLSASFRKPDNTNLLLWHYLFTKDEITLRGGLNMFNASGNEDDHKFPVTTAYKAPMIGVGIKHFFSPSFAIGFDFRYGFSDRFNAIESWESSKGPCICILINANTPKKFTFLLNAYKYFPLFNRLLFFASAGAGSEYRWGRYNPYNPYSIINDLPTKSHVALLAAGGLGFKYMLTDFLGVSLEFQGAYIFRNPGQIVFTPALGINLSI